MKQGRTLEELATEIIRQAQSKSDFMADTRRLVVKLEMPDETPHLDVHSKGVFPIGQHAHRQIGERLGIPAKYYDRMMHDAPDLLAQNINHWFRSTPEMRMVRVLDSEVRAFLSERYRPMDNYDLSKAVLPTLASSGATVQSCEITESRLYIKAVIESVQRTIPAPSDNRQQTPVVVSPGIVVSNSEVGMGSLAIQPAVHFLSCTNLAVWAQHALRKYHAGRPLVVSGGGGGNGNGGDDVWRFLSDETRQLTDAALWSQVKDVVVGALDGTIFDSIVMDLWNARNEIIDHPIPTVTQLATTKGLGQDEHDGVLHYLMQGGDLSRFGLSNAITRFSQDVESYDRATELETLGGEVIAMSVRDWRALRN